MRRKYIHNEQERERERPTRSLKIIVTEFLHILKVVPVSLGGWGFRRYGITGRGLHGAA